MLHVKQDETKLLLHKRNFKRIVLKLKITQDRY